VKTVSLRRLQLSADAERERAKLLREVEISKALPLHPKIVRMFDAFQEGSWFFMILELVGEKTLFTVLTGRRPSRLLELEAKFVFGQMVEGLRFLHDRCVIHRDLKLENVLVASEHKQRQGVFYSVKITDFGLSKALGAGCCVARSLVGTRPYTAPEVESGSPYEFSSDIWCLGVLSYVLLAGKFPFGRTPAAQVEVDDCVDRLRGSEMAKSSVSGMLQLMPSSRLSLDAISDLEWLQEEEGCGQSHGGTERSTKRARRETGAEVAMRDDGGSALAARLDPALALSPGLDSESRATPTRGLSGVGSHKASEPSGKQACAESSAESRMEGTSTIASSVAALTEPTRDQGVVHHCLWLEEWEKSGAVARLLDLVPFQQAVVFVRSACRATDFEAQLAAIGFPVTAIHSDLAQALCVERYEGFRRFEKRVLISTDVLHRTAYAPRVDLVLNVDIPHNSRQYSSRLGSATTSPLRSGGGASGRVVTFAASEGDRLTLRDIQQDLGLNVTPFPWKDVA
jgi:serine/threonine protein kinase